MKLKEMVRMIKNYEQLMQELDHIELQRKLNTAEMRIKGMRRLYKAYEEALRGGKE